MKPPRMCQRALLAVALCGPPMALETRAAAQTSDKDAARPHFNQGVRNYNLGRFEEAIANFEKAYELAPAPILIFNIAQSYRQLGKKDKALFFYRRYLEQQPNANNRAEVEQRMRDLEASLENENKLKQKPPTEVDTDGGPTPGGAGGKQLAQNGGGDQAKTDADLRRRAEEKQRSDEEEAARRRKLRIASLAVGGTGVAMGAAGVIFRGIATSKIEAIESDRANGRPYDPSNGNYQTFEGLGWGMMIGGAAAVATGLIGYFYYRGEQGSEPVVALQAGPNDFALTLAGRF